jgi:hypothetical protein
VKFSNSVRSANSIRSATPVRPEPVEGLELEGFGELFVNPLREEIRARRSVRCAFVSTNSIVQGEQVGVLWGWMLAQGIQIQFAHRTFQWSNDAPGKAAVHCVIVGFGMEARAPRLFDYEDIKASAHEVRISNLNPYLVDAPTVVLPSRRVPICDVSEMTYGSKPTDGGHLLMTDEEKNELIAVEPKAKPWIRQFLGADEFLNNEKRWCLWLKDCSPQTLKTMPHVLAQVEQVRKMRLASSKIPTKSWADKPTLFIEDRQSKSNYLLVPSVTSENRKYVPLGYVSADVICSNANFMLPNATLFHFGVLTSAMHNAWMRYTCGRLESRYRYSNTIVYNNYPWPQDASDKARQGIESAAQAVLDARAVHQAGPSPASLATLYNPATMPANLLAAHKALDKAVDAAYLEAEKSYALRQAQGERLAKGERGVQGERFVTPELKTDAQRVAFLFGLYARYTSLLG